MARCFAESKQAYTSGDGGKAKELSNQGKHHQSEMERYNKEASDWIFRGTFLFVLHFTFLVILTMVL